MKVYCKNCNSENWIATSNTVYCVKCGQPIYKTKEIPIYTKEQVEELQDRIYNIGFEEGVEEGFMLGYDLALSDLKKYIEKIEITQKEEPEKQDNFYMKRFTKIN